MDENIEQQNTPAQTEAPRAPVPSARKSPVKTIVSVLVLLVILGAIPVSVIYLGNKTRQELKAANECKTPSIPDPSECAGGQWQLYKNAEGCTRFRCEPR